MPCVQMLIVVALTSLVYMCMLSLLISMPDLSLLVLMTLATLLLYSSMLITSGLTCSTTPSSIRVVNKLANLNSHGPYGWIQSFLQIFSFYTDFVRF